jgi:TP901 family phage tail tape measure protein
MSSLTTRVLYDLVARDNASRTFLRVGEAAGDLESRSSKVGAAISKGLKVGTLAAGALAVASVHAATEFQSGMTKISTQAGASTKDVKILSDQVLKLGGKVQQGPDALADSLYHLKSVGLDNAKAMKALREASDLAAVGGADLEETTNALAGAWRTGIRGATDFHQAVATVNAIIGAGNMRMADFNAAIGTGILASAKTFGLSLQQVGAALALMTDEGIPATDAATRLRMSFSLLGAPSQAAEKQLKKIHLTGLQLAQAMRSKDGLIGAVQLLKTHLDASGLSAAQESQLLSRAFGGGRSSSGILTLLNNLDVLKQKQDQINKSTSKFDDAVRQQRKTAEAEWKRLESALESGSIRLGTYLLPPVTSFVGFLNDKVIPAAGQVGRALGSVIPVGKIKKDIAEVESTVGGFLSGLTGGKGLGSTLSDFLGGLTGKKAGVTLPKASPAPKNLPPSAVAHGMGVHPGMDAGTRAAPPPKNLPPSVVAHGLTPQKIAPPPSAAQQFGKTIRDSISGGIENINWGKLGASLGQGLGSMFQWIGAHGAELSKKLGKALGSIDWVDVGKQLGGVALPFAIGFIDNLFEPMFHADFWKKHWLDTILAVMSVVPIGRVGGVLEKIGSKIPWGKLGDALERVPWSKIIPLSEKLAEAGSKIALKISEFVGKLALDFAGAFARKFPKVAEWFARELSLLPIRLGVLGIDLAQKGAGLITKLGDAIVSHVPGMGNRFIRAAAKTLGRFTLYQTGLNLAESLINGAWSKLKAIGGWFQSHLVDPVIHWVKTGFGIASPSKVFTGIGGNLITGLKNGVLNAAKGIGGWITSHVVTPITSRFSGAGGWLVSKGSSFVSGLKSGVSAGAKGIGGWITSHVASPARGAFNSAGSWLKGAGGSFVSGLKSGISSGVRGIGSWLKKYLVDPIVSAVKHYFGIKSPSRVFMSIGGHLVSGLVKGLAVTSGTDIARTVFGDLPHALGSIVNKGLVSLTKLPGKALSALGKLGGSFLNLLGLGGGGGGSSANQKIGETLAATYGWSGPQWTALRALWNGESGWNERALNKSSGAYGIPQSLPASKMASAGADWRTNPAPQIKWGLSYIKSVYGSPLAAYSKWLSRSPHWYAKGTRGAMRGAAKGLAWVGERGAELVNFSGGEDVLSHEDSVKFARAHGIRLPGYASGTITNAADRVRRDKQAVEDAKDALSRAKRRRKGEAAAEKHLKAAEKELAAAEVSLRNAQRSAKTSISNTIKTGLEKTLSTGTASAITSAIKSLATKLLNAGYDKTAASIQKKGSTLSSLATKKANIESTITAANNYANDQAGNIKDFLSVSGTSAASVSDLIAQMTSQQKTATSFVSLSKTLKARGASKDLLQALSDAGPGSQLASILGAKNVTTGDIGKLNKLFSSGNSLATSFGRDMADLMYDSGKDAGKGFLAGLKGQEKDLEKQMSKLAKDLVSQIKKALKIKSPSQVFRDQVGRQIALGMVVGMDAHRPHVAAAGRRLAATAYAATAGASSARANAAFDQLAQLINSGKLGGAEVHVHFDDPTLKDLIRVTAKPMIQASASQQAHRAKVGRRTG